MVGGNSDETDEDGLQVDNERESEFVRTGPKTVYSSSVVSKGTLGPVLSTVIVDSHESGVEE